MKKEKLNTKATAQKLKPASTKANNQRKKEVE